VRIDAGGVVQGSSAINNITLWGVSATANSYAVNMRGGRLHIGTAATNLTLVGALTATKDFQVDGLATLPAFDFGASPPQYTASRNCTWALLATAVGSGGFGSQATNPASGAGVTSTVA